MQEADQSAESQHLGQRALANKRSLAERLTASLEIRESITRRFPENAQFRRGLLRSLLTCAKDALRVIPRDDVQRAKALRLFAQAEQHAEVLGTATDFEKIAYALGRRDPASSGAERVIDLEEALRLLQRATAIGGLAPHRALASLEAALEFATLTESTPRAESALDQLFAAFSAALRLFEPAPGIDSWDSMNCAHALLQKSHESNGRADKLKSATEAGEMLRTCADALPGNTPHREQMLVQLDMRLTRAWLQLGDQERARIAAQRASEAPRELPR